MLPSTRSSAPKACSNAIRRRHSNVEFLICLRAFKEFGGIFPDRKERSVGLGSAVPAIFAQVCCLPNARCVYSAVVLVCRLCLRCCLRLCDTYRADQWCSFCVFFVVVVEGESDMVQSTAVQKFSSIDGSTEGHT